MKTMEKKLSDYLHFYIGCKAMVSRPISYQAEDITPAMVAHLHQLGKSWDLYKPILRPISDMSEEEAIEVCKLQTEDKRKADVEVHDISHCDIHYTDGSKWYGDGVEEVNDLYVHFDRLNPDQFKFLLSNGFDLFSLIHSGLALDATTLKK